MTMQAKARQAAGPGTRGAVPDSATLEQLRSWWNGAPVSHFVEEPDAALTRTLVNAGWIPERTGRWCGRPFDDSPCLLQARMLEGVTIELVADDDGAEQWLDVAADCRWIEDRAARRALLRASADDPRQAMWLARLDDRPVGMARGWCREPVVEVVDVAVQPAVRRKGVGTSLVPWTSSIPAIRHSQDRR